MDVTKIIKAKIGHSNYVVAEPIMKEDYGLYLLIEGIDLPQSYEVDFSNELRDGTSITMIGDENGVRIPEQFIEPGRNVYAFYYHVGSDFGRTLYTIRIPNRARPERTDETPTPVQQSAIDQAISALNTAVERTAQDVISADQSAQEADQSAEQAHEASIDAQNFAEQAEQSAGAAATSASQANTSASNAAQSASQSAQIKSDIEGFVDDAQRYAQESAQSASDAEQTKSDVQALVATAQQAVTDASHGADLADASARSASASASAASASAQSADSYASQAQGHAQTASTKASEAAQSATSANTAKTDAVAAKTAAQTAQTAAETAQGLAEDAQEAAETAAQSIEASAAQIATNTADIADVKRDLNDKAPVVIETASGSIASFADGADDMPMKSLIVNIEPVQSGSGDPSPDNVRPISGWTGCEVAVSPTTDAQDGTAYPISWASEAGTVYGGTLDVVSGVLTVDRQYIDMGSLSWSAGYTGFFTVNVGWTGDFICEMYPQVPYVSSTSQVDKTITWNSGSHALIAADSAYSDAASFKTAMSNVGLVTKLATPQTYQLTPTEVKSILGQNNVWADCGDVEVEYRADTKMFVESQITDVPVEDVQINGTSIVSDGVANVPLASSSALGTVKIGEWSDTGLVLDGNGVVYVATADQSRVKAGTTIRTPITPSNQHSATFYGLAKAAGDTTQSASSNAVGSYTEDAKSKISEMLGGSVSVSGTTPTIVAKSGIRYVCGEVSTLDLTPPASGICDVVFTSGSTATVLTVPSTVKWANGFDPTALDADTTYEINIMDGLGVAVGWT